MARWRRISCIATAALAVACTLHPPDTIAPAREDSNDRAYLLLRAKSEGCRESQQDTCCPGLVSALDAAVGADDMMSAAATLDAILMTCRSHRSPAIVALYHKPKPIAGARPGVGIEVRYEVRLGASDRLYWMGAFVDGRSYPDEPLPPGRHDLEVSAHVMTAAGTQEDSLFRITAHKTFEVPQSGGAVVSARLEPGPANGGSPFALVLRALPALSAAPVARPAAKVEPRPARLARRNEDPNSIRLPAELATLPILTLQEVCLSPEGRVDGVTPLLPRNHPRVLGTLLDFFAHAEYEPHLEDGKAVSFCFRYGIKLQ
jgi:hypothetical protein